MKPDNEVENLKLAAGNAKAPVGIVPMHILYGMARVLEDSACKYAPFNYMTQPLVDALSSYDSALLRHRIACTLYGGEVTPESYAAPDEDSGLPHIFHMLTGLAILATLMIRDGIIKLDPGPGLRKLAKDGKTPKKKVYLGPYASLEQVLDECYTKDPSISAEDFETEEKPFAPPHHCANPDCVGYDPQMVEKPAATTEDVDRELVAPLVERINEWVERPNGAFAMLEHAKPAPVALPPLECIQYHDVCDRCGISMSSDNPMREEPKPLWCVECQNILQGYRKPQGGGSGGMNF